MAQASKSGESDRIRVVDNDYNFAQAHIRTWQWERVQDDTVIMRSGYFFDKKKATDSYDYHNSDHGAIKELVLMQDLYIVPPPATLMFYCYAHVFNRRVRALAQEGCHGCKYDSLSQRAHMDSLGCLSDFDDLRNYYETEAHASIAVEIVATLYDQTRSCFALPRDPEFEGVNIGEVPPGLREEITRMRWRGSMPSDQDIPRQIQDALRTFSSEFFSRTGCVCVED